MNDHSAVARHDGTMARLEPYLAGHPVAWDWDGLAEAQAHYATLGFAPELPVE